MLDGSRQLIGEWEASGMEEDGCCSRCCCGGVGGGETRYRQQTLIQFLRQKDTRLQRMARFLSVAVLLLISMTLASLIATVYGARCHQSPESQPTMLPLPGITIEQQQRKDLNNPSAMLTAPKGNVTDADYLEWESHDGHAFCHGGFSYSSGNLVVPRNGIYRVFLQITYESTKDIQCPSSVTSTVYLFRETYNNNVRLLSSVDTVTCSMEQWSKSLYTAGLFFLETNCRLRVKSSHPDLIVKREYEVFFGAELLPQ